MDFTLAIRYSKANIIQKLRLPAVKKERMVFGIVSAAALKVTK